MGLASASSVIALMVIVECFDVGLSTISKAAMSNGMSDFVFIVYSNLLALFILLPSSFFFYRRRSPTPLTFSIICKIFLLGLLGTCLQLCIYLGIGYSSPTLNSAMIDLTPAFTFLLAITCRMEKLDLRTQSSRAKSLGTILSIGGALVVTLYKGLPLIVSSSPYDLPDENELHLSLESNWVIGGILLAIGAFILSILYIVQTWIIKAYPEELIIVAVGCVFVTIQSAVVALIAERNPNAWRLRVDMELIAVLYSAVFSVTGRNIVHTWACRKKGPVYVCMFKPLGIVIAIVMGIAFLGDTLYLGSVVGGALIACGFYAVIWGKAEEESMIKDKTSSSFDSSSCKFPLLQNKSNEV